MPCISANALAFCEFRVPLALPVLVQSLMVSVRWDPLACASCL
jgi:hypothetical protein